MDDIRHRLETAADEDAILRAVTTEAGLTGWWGRRAGVDGHDVTLQFTKDDREVIMEFRSDPSVNPVVWTCTANGNPAWVGTTLCWEVEDLGETRAVDFTHSGFTMGGPPYETTAETWRHFMTSLGNYLRDGIGQPWD